MDKPFPSGHFLGAADLNRLVGILDLPTAEIDVVSTTTETDVYTKAIAAGAMSTDRLLALLLAGDMLNDTGANRSFSIRVEFDGTLIWGDDFAIATSTRRRAWWMLLTLQNVGAANAQRLGGFVAYSDARATVSATGLGSLLGIFGQTAGSSSGETAGRSTPISGTSAIDTSLAKTLAVTCTPDTSSASLSLRRRSGVLFLA